ncbi:hypothetical protein HDU93_008112 [Gonapodya sp. JEL0774]|nr:hypothetical protein HDU93_008112 [Gonapodya sp. JEL0774]
MLPPSQTVPVATTFERRRSSLSQRVPHGHSVDIDTVSNASPTEVHSHPYSLIHDIALHASRFFAAAAAGPDQTQAAQLSSQLASLVWQVTPAHLNVRPPTDGIEYYPVFESVAFTMCVFVMKRGATIPVHDHPGMNVFSKVVSGTLHVRSYDLLSHPQPQRVSNPSFTSAESQISPIMETATTLPLQPGALPPVLTARPAKIVLDADISAADPRSLLTIHSDSGNNLHSFTAVSDVVVVLDIIGPPYDDRGRICKYFREVGDRERRSMGLPRAEKWGNVDGTPTSAGGKERKSKRKHHHHHHAHTPHHHGSGTANVVTGSVGQYSAVQSNMDWEVFDFSSASLGQADPTLALVASGADSDKWALYDKSTGSVGVYDLSTGSLHGVYDASTGQLTSLAAALGGLSVAGRAAPAATSAAGGVSTTTTASDGHVIRDEGKRLWLVEDPQVDYDCTERTYSGEMVYLTGAVTGAPGIAAGVVVHSQQSAAPVPILAASVPVVPVVLPVASSSSEPVQPGVAQPSTRKRREAARAMGPVGASMYSTARNAASSSRQALQQQAVQQRLEAELRALGYDVAPSHQQTQLGGVGQAGAFGSGISVDGLASLMGTSAMEFDWDTFDVSTRSLPGM